MKFPRYRIGTLLLLTALLGGVFLACARWPVTETGPETLGLSSNTSGGVIATWTVTTELITRPPTLWEWTIRASIAAVLLVLLFVLVGLVRSKSRAQPAN